MREKSKYAGQVLKVKETGEDFIVEDWCENVLGCSWMYANGNPTAMMYGVKAGCTGLPIDNQVLYGKIGGMGALFHESELDVPGK